MKAINLFLYFCLFTGFAIPAQPSDTISLTTNKTTNVLFDYPIINVDRGSADVLAQEVNGIKNALQLKAARRDFEETNLSVYTADGEVHEFTLRYAALPLRRVYLIRGDATGPATLQHAVNARDMEKLTRKILFLSGRGKIAGQKRYHMEVRLKDIYIKDNVILFHLQMVNHTKVIYDMASLRFFIKDIKSAKRTPVQERELMPVYTSNNTKAIGGEEKLDVIYAFSKFTIPDAKKLHIVLREQNGGRDFLLKVRNGKMIRAEAL